MQLLRKLFDSISADKTKSHRMVWQSPKMEHTQRRNRSILGVLLLADVHGRCTSLFHTFPFDCYLWCQIELYLLKQFLFTSCLTLSNTTTPRGQPLKNCLSVSSPPRRYFDLKLVKKHWRIMKITFFFAALFFMDFFTFFHGYVQYPLPDIEDAKFIDDCVRAHNTFRSKVNPPASNMLRMVRWCLWSFWNYYRLDCWFSPSCSSFLLCYSFHFS